MNQLKIVFILCCLSRLGMPTLYQEDKSSVLLLLFAQSNNESGIDSYCDDDGLSLNEKLENWSPNSEKITDYANSEEIDSLGKLCQNAPEESRLITIAISNVLNFYEAHVEKINDPDGLVGVRVLEGVLLHIFKRRSHKLHFAMIRRTNPLIKQIINQIVNSTGDNRAQEEINQIVNERTLFSRCAVHWKPSSFLHKRKVGISSIGDDKDSLCPQLNGKCQAALINRCEIPTECQQSFLEASPQSQYTLTHQALFTLFGIQKSCELENIEMFRGWENNVELQCSKMLKEAEFIAGHGPFPDFARDIFAEYVFISAMAGYPNLLRSEWIKEIQSWQSQSEYGCFINPGTKSYVSSEIKILRKPTPAEEKAGEFDPEVCHLHLTSVSLSALAMKLEYLHDKCLPYNPIEYDSIWENFVSSDALKSE